TLSEDAGTVAIDWSDGRDRRIEVYAFIPNKPSALVTPRRTIPVPPGFSHWLSRDGRFLFVEGSKQGKRTHHLFAFDVANANGSNLPAWEIEFVGHDRGPDTVLTADGKRLVVLFIDGPLEVWDGPTGKRLLELPRADGYIRDGGGE